ncbi:hypothetical protein HK100_010099 [Physocladia obscura]|uniref:Heterokaryon incompatibility domain-containing protein n=1 Tax=Physocladia obscura TaxID=109957 RepID=A0AAD5T2N8_9FUNG|nr:hypothetical protein HK100_010099 [Physocladia obscura]
MTENVLGKWQQIAVINTSNSLNDDQPVSVTLIQVGANSAKFLANQSAVNLTHNISAPVTSYIHKASESDTVINETLPRNSSIKTSYFINGKLNRSNVLSSAVAISHNWGEVNLVEDPSNENNRGKTLICNLMKLKAIKQFIMQSTQPVWLDLYAIDQNEHDDKCAQVQIMPDIYAQAESVCVFLSPEDYHTLMELVKISDTLIELFAKISEEGVRDDDAGWKINDFGWSYDVINSMPQEYFTRAWTLQELFLAKKIQAVSYDDYGNLIVFNFEQAISTISKANTALHEDVKYLNVSEVYSNARGFVSNQAGHCAMAQVLAGFDNVRKVSAEEKQEEMAFQALYNSFRKCSVIHDVVYSRIGLLGLKMEVNYKQPFWKVVVEARCQLAAKMYLNVVCSAADDAQWPENEPLPNFIKAGLRAGSLQFTKAPYSCGLLVGTVDCFRVGGTKPVDTVMLDDKLVVKNCLAFKQNLLHSEPISSFCELCREAQGQITEIDNLLIRHYFDPDKNVISECSLSNKTKYAVVHIGETVQVVNSFHRELYDQHELDPDRILVATGLGILTVNKTLNNVIAVWQMHSNYKGNQGNLKLLDLITTSSHRQDLTFDSGL